MRHQAGRRTEGGGFRKTSPWSRYVDSAVGAGTSVLPPGSRPGAPAAGQIAERQDRMPGEPGPAPLRTVRQRHGALVRLARQRAGELVAGAGHDAAHEASRRRTDVRLAFPAVLTWGAAISGLWLPPPALAVLCLAMLALAVLLLVRLLRKGRTGRRGTGRSTLATTAAALLIAAATASHSSVASSQRFDGPLAAAITSGKTAVAMVEVAGAPRALGGPAEAGPSPRWAVPVWTREVATGGVLLRTRARLVVIGGGAWGTVVPGQAVRAMGKLRPPDPGRLEAGTLAASSGPQAADDGSGLFGGTGLERAAKDLRTGFVAASAFLGSDAAGLLPGMATGDTSALDEGLEHAMKAVGMTHLTAVSGANCSLVLGALVLACRGIRLPRLPAAAAALTGLGLFVVLVGPDASVLRAALMGGIAVAALAAGRSGRGLSFLCLAVTGLLLVDPGLGSSFGFLLSVLATLGIIVLGRPIIDRIPPRVPRWAAAALAVPLSAQLLCGPVIVLLQPSFSTYSLPANVAAAPLVAPVTLLATAAVPLVAAVPWLATVLIAVAGTFCAGVAGIARFAAGLPGATLPWPEGMSGMLSMLFLSALTLAAVRAATRPAGVIRLAQAAHRRTVRLLERAELLMATLHCCGLDRRRGHGRLEYSTRLSRRDAPWPLPQSEQPVPRRRMRPPGARLRPPPSSWSADRRNTWASGRWTVSVPRSGRLPRTWK